MMTISPEDWLDHGALGASMLVLLISMTILFRVLRWARDLMELVLSRLQDNTTALVRLSERLHDAEGEQS